MLVRAVIWDALKAACEADFETAKIIIESAGIIVAAPDMTVMYDERGACLPGPCAPDARMLVRTMSSHVFALMSLMGPGGVAL